MTGSPRTPPTLFNKVSATAKRSPQKTSNGSASISELLAITDDPLAYAKEQVRKYNQEYKDGKVEIHKYPLADFGVSAVVDVDGTLGKAAFADFGEDLADKLLALFGYSEADVAASKLDGIEDKIREYGTAKVCEECGVGAPTLHDIVKELQKPGRDIRDSFEPVELRQDVMNIEDLKPDMVLTGTVRNVIDFGAFVDIGVHQDGLVHISELSDRFVKHPSDVVSLGDKVEVRVLSVDVKKKRIALSMKKAK